MKQGKNVKKSHFLDLKKPKHKVITWAYRPKVLGLKTTINQVNAITKAMLYFSQQF